MGHGSALAIGAHFVDDGGQRLAEGVVEFCAVGGAAYGVQFEGPVGDAYAIEQRGQEFENFRVSRGRLAAGGGGPDNFRSDLIELAVAALLWTLAAELRPDIEELVETAVPELVPDVGADHARGIFRTKGQRLPFIAFGAAAILPCKHLFADNIRLFT